MADGTKGTTDDIIDSCLDFVSSTFLFYDVS